MLIRIKVGVRSWIKFIYFILRTRNYYPPKAQSAEKRRSLWPIISFSKDSFMQPDASSHVFVFRQFSCNLRPKIDIFQKVDYELSNSKNSEKRSIHISVWTLLVFIEIVLPLMD